jgi:hypothetical protein
MLELRVIEALLRRGSVVGHRIVEEGAGQLAIPGRGIKDL